MSEATSVPWWATLLAGSAIAVLAREIGNTIAGRRESRKPVGRALSELLEMRHQVLGVRAAMEELQAQFPQLDGHWPVIRAAIVELSAQFCSDQQALRNRYNVAVDAVAEVNPVLAFQLRAKDTFPGAIQWVSQSAAQNTILSPVSGEISTILTNLFEGELDKLARDLAWRHGLLTYFRTRRALRRKPKMPREAQEFLAVMKARVAELESGNAAAAAPAAHQG